MTGQCHLSAKLLKALLLVTSEREAHGGQEGSKVGSHHQIRRKALGDGSGDGSGHGAHIPVLPPHQQGGGQAKGRLAPGLEADWLWRASLHFKRIQQPRPAQPALLLFIFLLLSLPLCCTCGSVTCVQCAVVVACSGTSEPLISALQLISFGGGWHVGKVLSLPSISCLKRLAKDLKTGAGMSASTRTYLKARIKTLTLLDPAV